MQVVGGKLAPFVPLAPAGASGAEPRTRELLPIHMKVVEDVLISEASKLSLCSFTVSWAKWQIQ
eukprot:6485733-Amphidinium_carterae.1